MPHDEVIMDELVAPGPPPQVGIFNPNLQMVVGNIRDGNAVEQMLAAAPRRVRNVRVEVNQHIPVHWEDAPEPVPYGAPKPMKAKKDGSLMTLEEYLGRHTEGLFGYELEVEGDNLPIRIDGWKTAKDGSLRGESAEYILLEPSSLEGTIKSFETLVSKLVKPATKLSFSYRTSTHVHVNMLKFTKPQIQAFFYLSHLVEDVLVNYCAPNRKGNRFCLRTKDAEWKVEQFKEWLAKNGFGALSQEHLKYSAINIATLMHYGSMEFRSLHGTVDKEVVTPWLNVLKNIHDIAAIVPVKEMEDIVKKSPMDILNVVFKEHLPKFQYTGMEKDVMDAYERLISIPYVKLGV